MHARRIGGCLVATVWLCLSTWNVAAASPPKHFEVGAIDQFLQAVLAERGQPGLSVAIVRAGEVVLAKGYGRRSLEPQLPVETDTRFAIGSITKQFTCACVLLLAEEGKLSVDDKVAKYYPGLTRAADITLLDLMHHVSGYPDYYPLDYVDERMQQPIDPDELLRRYAGGSLDFEPGTRYSYSNTGFILLGRVVEKVSGASFGEFLQRRILQPLGMDHTVYAPSLSDPGQAHGYTTFALSAAEAVAPEAAGWIGSAGAIHSTPSDLAQWDLALIDGKVLKPESLRLMTHPRTLTNGRQTDYGCGLGVRTQNGRTVLGHSGAVSGFCAWNYVVPSTRSAVIVMSNQDGGLGDLPAQLLNLLLEEPSPAVPTVQGLSAADAARRLFVQLQKGTIRRAGFSEAFNTYLTEERLRGAAKRLKPFGKVTSADLVATHERGGMEVSIVRLKLRKGALRTLMYRRPDGLVEQFFVDRE